jgi:hypothetical protein
MRVYQPIDEDFDYNYNIMLMPLQEAHADGLEVDPNLSGTGGKNPPPSSENVSGERAFR